MISLLFAPLFIHIFSILSFLLPLLAAAPPHSIPLTHCLPSVSRRHPVFTVWALLQLSSSHSYSLLFSTLSSIVLVYTLDTSIPLFSAKRTTLLLSTVSHSDCCLIACLTSLHQSTSPPLHDAATATIPLHVSNKSLFRLCLVLSLLCSSFAVIVVVCLSLLPSILSIRMPDTPRLPYLLSRLHVPSLSLSCHAMLITIYYHALHSYILFLLLSLSPPSLLYLYSQLFTTIRLIHYHSVIYLLYHLLSTTLLPTLNPPGPLSRLR